MSDILLANIEALASEESEGTTCTVNVSCSDNPNDYVKCSGSRKCTRGYRSVTCDGMTTVC